MKNNRFFKFFEPSAKIIAILILLACAGGPADLNEFTSYFMPESAQSPAGDNRYNYTQQFLYLSEYEDTLEVAATLNSQAWAKYANVSEAIAYQFFYGENKTDALSQRLLLRGNKAAVNYLQLARKIDQAYTPAIYSWDETQRDSLALEQAYVQVQAQAQNAPDDFLKERYGFQAVKLAMILQKPEECLKLYDRFIKPLKTKTFISDWAYSRKAGASLALGDTARAIYEFAQVFERCPSRRKEADLSLRIKGITFQEKALSYCQNDAEKAAVYALCAIQPLEDGLPFLKKIVELNPKNKLLELITAREINKNEYYALNSIPYVEDTAAYQERQKESKTYFEQLGDFTAQCAQNPALSSSAFWNTANSYISYINKDYDQASKALEKAKSMQTSNAILKQQIEVQTMLLLIAKQDKITPEFENQAIGMLEGFTKSNNFRVVNAYTRACDLLAKMYRGQPLDSEKKAGWLSGCSSKSSDIPKTYLAKAFLFEIAASWQARPTTPEGYSVSFATNTDRYAIEDSTSIELLQEVLKYIQAPNLTDFDKKLLQLSAVHQDQINLLMGRKHLVLHEYTLAASAFANIPAQTWQQEPFATYLDQNPFYLTPDNGQKANPSMTPYQFAKRMAELEAQMKQGDAQAAYLLGCGAYNMGYWGNSWILTNRQRSSSEYQYMYPKRDLSQDDYYVASKAKSYFDKAIALSKSSELSAKAAYGGALCQRNAFAVYEAAASENIGYSASEQAAFTKKMNQELRQRLNNYFLVLKQQYPDAQYTREVLEECATYRYYAGRK
ncbi:hypothetical protein [Runella zeae]|uniref:hypothetical protein n=1 Tax=Runella zeae TaxID=94255 RepID=UPI00040777B5|nr:hypothetical protein [Runella zeae]